MSDLQDETCAEKDALYKEAVLDELRKIHQQLEEVNSKPLMAFEPSSTTKELGLQLVKGMLFGLGSFLGATIVVSIVIYLLSTIEFIPYIGEIVKEILQEVRK